MASLIGEFSLFYSIFPLQRPWVTSSWLARLSARLTTIDIRAMRTQSESSGTVKSICGRQHGPAYRRSLAGASELTPVFLGSENSGRPENSEAFYSFQ